MIYTPIRGRRGKRKVCWSWSGGREKSESIDGFPLPLSKKAKSV
jgi:hypothetical protein